jgi:ABC-type phosphate/phosphonate transport system ATPase subunit
LEKQSGKEVLQMQQNANMQFVHTELVQVFYDIKWISSETFEFTTLWENCLKVFSSETSQPI